MTEAEQRLHALESQINATAIAALLQAQQETQAQQQTNADALATAYEIQRV